MATESPSRPRARDPGRVNDENEGRHDLALPPAAVVQVANHLIAAPARRSDSAEADVRWSIPLAALWVWWYRPGTLAPVELDGTTSDAPIPRPRLRAEPLAVPSSSPRDLNGDAAALRSGHDSPDDDRRFRGVSRGAAVHRLPGDDASPLAGTEVHYLRSEHVGDEFKIFIGHCGGSDVATPAVLYVADANGMFASAVDIVRLMQLSAHLPPILVEGIGYRMGALGDTVAVRTRDFTPTSDALIARIAPTVTEMGGAGRFLAFIRDELQPWVASRYRVDAADSVDFGRGDDLTVLGHTPVDHPHSQADLHDVVVDLDVHGLELRGGSWSPWRATAALQLWLSDAEHRGAIVRETRDRGHLPWRCWLSRAAWRV